ECRQDSRNGPQDARQEILPPHQLSGRHQGNRFREAACALSGSRTATRGEGHVAQGPAWLRDAEKTQDIRRRQAPALGAAAKSTGDLTWSATITTARDGARVRWRAYS